MKRYKAVAVLSMVLGLWLVPARPAQAINWQESPEVSKVFIAAGVQGTFVLYDAKANRFTGHDRRRAGTRFIPASTYKIPNTLIGLATYTVENVDVVLPYGGQPQPIKAWEKDMALREAIKVSNVPVYKELARRIGLETMRTQLKRIDYGNNEIGNTVDNFWLVGPLKISAIEQTEFLARLATGKLPFLKRPQKETREIVLLEQGKGWALYGKTGVADSYDPDLGWWVGWVEKGNHVYSFALNIDMPESFDLAKRIEIGKASLKILGIIQADQ